MKTHTIKTHLMKKLLLLLLLFTGTVNAQIVNIPDANFKARLISLGVDLNNDNEIQTFEANLINTLNLENSSINNLIGIAAFTNLNSLYCNDNNLTFLDLSSNINLTFLRCRNNQIGYLNVSNNPNLTDLLADNNQLNGINISNNPNLNVLWIADNNLTTLNTTSCVNLTYLWCSNNNLTSLDVSNSINLFKLFCDHNQLTTLNLSVNIHLFEIYCAYNQLTSINVLGLNELTSLDCSDNSLTTINVSGLSNLITFYCNYNFNVSLTMTGLLNLKYFACNHCNLSLLDIPIIPTLLTIDCSTNNLTTIDVSNFPNLQTLDCKFNQLTTIDVSNQSQLVFLLCNNNLLTTLFIKNGSNETLIVDNNPNLQYVCADEGQLLTIVTQVSNSTVVNSYCTFIPAGNYNIITGQIKYDSNSNDCDTSDLPVSNIRMNMTQWGLNSATFSNNSGNYTFYTTFADQLVEPIVENQSWFNFTPASATISFPNNDNNTFIQDFCIAPVGNHTDLEIVIEPVTPARPGFNAVYKIVYKNKGNTTPGFNSGVRFEFNPNKMTFISASQTVGTQSSTYINFDYSNLRPFESRSILVTFLINSPTDSNPVTIGDVLSLHANIGLNIGDENFSDNNFYYNQTVVGSFDPNNIVCIEGPIVSTSQIGQYLHYAINFENTGNYQAQNVVVKDAIDTSMYDINSLQMLNTSHSSFTKVTGDTVEFMFENINLAAAEGSPPVGGHGNILFKIKSKTNLVANDFVTKKAKIYFDYNAPINTNIAQTTFQLLSNNVFELDASVVVHPNPTNGILNINSDFNIKSIALYDIQGRLLQTDLENSNETILDLSTYQSGIYFVKINTEKGSKVEKIIKE